MTIQRHDSNARMSQAVVHNGVAYLAGQVASGDSVTAQTEGILQKVEAQLTASGTDKSRLLSATIWLTSMDDFAEMNAVWDAWVDSDQPPARACVESPRLATPEFKVEIMVQAATD
ncbi:MAG: RidA family protein [Granulosicoccus sp.]|nr:RidA family protein [Granulosicoccus sp.]